MPGRSLHHVSSRDTAFLLSGFFSPCLCTYVICVLKQYAPICQPRRCHAPSPFFPESPPSSLSFPAAFPDQCPSFGHPCTVRFPPIALSPHFLLDPFLLTVSHPLLPYTFLGHLSSLCTLALGHVLLAKIFVLPRPISMAIFVPLPTQAVTAPATVGQTQKRQLRRVGVGQGCTACQSLRIAVGEVLNTLVEVATQRPGQCLLQPLSRQSRRRPWPVGDTGAGGRRQKWSWLSEPRSLTQRPE